METLTLSFEENGIVIVQLNRGKSNPINQLMAEELTNTFNELEKNDKINAVILCGNDEGFFSAGLDVFELSSFNDKEFAGFWKHFASMTTALVGFSKPLIAAISGHSPAGGCLLAICSDYRFMAEGNFKIGLNEVQVGVLLPESLYHLYSFWLGEGNAYRYIMEARMFTPQEALEIGLIDGVAPQNQLIILAKKKIEELSRFDHASWCETKKNIRRKLMQLVDLHPINDFQATINHWWAPKTQAMLKEMLNRLSKK